MNAQAKAHFIGALIGLAIVALLQLLGGCGRDECKGKPEVSVLALTSDSAGVLSAAAQFKDECADKMTKSVMAVKEGAEPASCTDGVTKTGYGHSSWLQLKSGASYTVRACAVLDNHVSAGIASTILVK